jgi:5-methylcytosine-specific restriction endonuclease McrA
MGENSGRRGSRWRKLVAEVRARHDPCWLDGMPIDYSLEYPHPDSFTVDHKKSWIGHPELREDPANLAACHSRCNKSKGQAQAKPGLGILSETW